MRGIITQLLPNVFHENPSVLSTDLTGELIVIYQSVVLGFIFPFYWD
jgi:hypothetical protein